MGMKYSVHDVDLIKTAIKAKDEEYGGDFLHDTIIYASNGQVLDMDQEDGNTAVPANWTFKVVDNNTEREYDSYGYSYTEDGYVVFEVSNGVDVALYKLPCSYRSHEGWNVDADELVNVKQEEQVITVWARTEPVKSIPDYKEFT